MEATERQLHGTQWADHVLHYCNAQDIQQTRTSIQQRCDRWAEDLDIDIQIQSITELSALPISAIPPDELLIDLRGFLVNTIHEQSKRFSFVPNDLALLFNSFLPDLTRLCAVLDVAPNPAAR